MILIRRLAALSLVALAVLAACGSSEAAPQHDEPSPARTETPSGTAASTDVRAGQHAGEFNGRVERAVAMKYLLHVPREYAADTARRWPVILYLHGGSLRGADVERLRRMGLPAVAEADSAFPFIVVSPLLPERQLWTDTDAVMALLDDVLARHRADPSRVYLTGHSVGGNGAWYVAYRHPERFAAVAPMAGPANPWWALRLARVPLWVFHGERDDIVSVDESRGMVDAVRAEGGADVRLTVLPGRDHFILDVYENRDLYRWFLRHALPPDAASARR